MPQLLNLLPPEKKKALRQGLVLAFTLSMTLLVFLVSLAVTAMFISVRLLLSNNYATLKAPVNSQDDYSDSAANIKQINIYVNRIDGYMKRSAGWTDRLTEISDIVPDGVVVDYMSFGGGRLLIGGYAATRDDLIVFTDRLAKQPAVSKLNSPLSNLLQKKDVKFELDMNYSVAQAAK